MSQNNAVARKTAFIFDRDVEMGRLEGALSREVTLVEFPVVMVDDNRWVPFTRVGQASESMGESAHVVMLSDDSKGVDITTRTMNVSDFYAEVVDRRWHVCA